MCKTVYLQKQPPDVFYKKAVLKDSAIFTAKQLCWSLFNNAAGLQPFNFIEKRLQRKSFPVNIAKRLLRTPFSKKTCKRLLLYLGTTVFKNIVIRNLKKHNHFNVFYKYLECPTQADLNLRRLQYSPGA